MRLRKLAFIAALACALAIYAQNPAHQAISDSIKHNTRYVMIDGEKPPTDSIRLLMENFYEDQFRHVQDPAAPYFMFMSRNANLAMGLGGEVILRGWYDWNGAMPDGSFMPYNIPMHPDATELRHLGATASGTKLFLRAMGRSSKLGRYLLYIEGEFTGYGEVDFALKKAYASLNDWTVGLASTTFSDPGALPPTVDRQGPNNKIDASAILVRWMHTWKKKWTMAASVEYPAELKMTNSEYNKRYRGWVPDLGLFIQYQRPENASQHVRLSFTTRQLTYRNLIERRNESSIGWGVQLSTMISPVSPLTLYATLNAGRGVAGIGGDWTMGNYDLIADVDEPGKMFAPHVLGMMLGVQYNFSTKLFADIVYSHAHYYPLKHGAPSDYKYGNYGSANLFYYITPRVRVGVGFNIGSRQNVDSDRRTVYRAGLLAAFSF